MQNDHIQQKHPRGSSPPQDIGGSPFTESLMEHQQEQRMSWNTPALHSSPAKNGPGDDDAD